MIWIIFLLGVAAFVYFLFAPRRFQTAENIPARVDRNFKAHHIVETTEDPREVRPIAQATREMAGDLPTKGHGDSLTKDWPSEKTEPHRQGTRPDSRT